MHEPLPESTSVSICKRTGKQEQQETVAPVTHLSFFLMSDFIYLFFSWPAPQKLQHRSLSSRVECSRVRFFILIFSHAEFSGVRFLFLSNSPRVSPPPPRGVRLTHPRRRARRLLSTTTTTPASHTATITTTFYDSQSTFIQRWFVHFTSIKHTSCSLEDNKFNWV